ncbi:hypothetical protein J4225_00505 [Candidatus Pacearchaeota archaeon]|nr:hypothetical protein [uncultured archaeon]MBS3085151.1 hypothetical protein [Candidatus Pacearchaeota archaeon]
MKIENHLESYKEHRETIFDWALKIKGLENSQRVIGTHASRAIIDLLAVYLLKRNLIDSGTKINHRWFKSKKVLEILPEFEGKEEIFNEIIKLELICEDLTYGSPKKENKIKEAIFLFNKIEAKLKNGET